MGKKRRENAAGKRRGRRIKWIDLIGYLSILGLFAAVGYLVAPQIQFGDGNSAGQTVGSRVVRAAVIDQLSSILPNSALLTSTYNMLTKRGIGADVVLPGDVTVGFYAHLPEYAYGLIILRVHTGIGDTTNGRVPTGLFTSEPYDPNRYVVEQASGLVGAAQAGKVRLWFSLSRRSLSVRQCEATSRVPS